MCSGHNDVFSTSPQVLLEDNYSSDTNEVCYRGMQQCLQTFVTRDPVNIAIEITKKMARKILVRFSKTYLTKCLSAGINKL
jgi:hypothetical protein